MSRAKPASADSSPGTDNRTSHTARPAPTTAPTSVSAARRLVERGRSDPDVIAVLYYAFPPYTPAGSCARAHAASGAGMAKGRNDRQREEQRAAQAAQREAFERRQQRKKILLGAAVVLAVLGAAAF